MLTYPGMFEDFFQRQSIFGVIFEEFRDEVACTRCDMRWEVVLAVFDETVCVFVCLCLERWFAHEEFVTQDTNTPQVHLRGEVNKRGFLVSVS